MNKNPLKTIGLILVVFFALIGFLFTVVFIGMQFGLFTVRGSIAERNAFFAATSTASTAPAAPVYPCVDHTQKICGWNETPEWAAIAGGLTKDAAVIARVSRETGVSKRMIAAVVVPEHTRFFTANREIFKKYFEPLKILGSLSQFSLGVSGIKEDTAKVIEGYANNPESGFYPGPGMADLIAYALDAKHDSELYNRLTDAKDHYYSYLYTALAIREFEAQWKAAGIDIAKKPEAVTTLFNIGFQGSHPNPEPVAGGALITTGGKTYAYGQLGANFYYSDELDAIFSHQQ